MMTEVAKYINKIGGISLELFKTLRDQLDETFRDMKSTYEASFKAHFITEKLQYLVFEHTVG